MAEGAADNIGAVELAIQAALDAASWNAAQAAAQQQGRIIGTQLAKAIQDTVAQTPITIRPRLQGGPDLDGFRRQASPQITPPPLPPPIPPGYLQQLQAAQGASAGLGSALGTTATQAGGLQGALSGLLGSLGPVAGAAVAAGGAVVGLTAALAGIGGAALLAVQPLIRVAGEAQKLKAAFDSLAGSESGGLAIRESLSRLSESTPFPDLEIQQLGRQFLAVGVEADALEGTINRIGALAAQSGQDVGRIGLIYAQVFAKGRLQYEENLQLLEAGIDLTEELSQVTGLTGNALRDAMSRGKVGVAEFNAALTLATGNMDALTKAALAVDVAQSNLGDNIGRVFRQLSVSVSPAISAVFGVLNKAFDDFLGENKLQTLATLFEPIRVQAERLAQTLINSPGLVQSIGSLLETSIRVAVDAIAGSLEFINRLLESGAVDVFAQRIADTELSFRRVSALLGPIIEDIAKFVQFTNNIQPLALVLSRGGSLEEARQAFGQLLAPDAWDGFAKGVQDAASQQPIRIDPIDLTLRNPRGNLDNREGSGADDPALAQRREQLIGIQQEQAKILATAEQEASLALALNKVYGDRSLSFKEQQAAAERVKATAEDSARLSQAEVEYADQLARLSRTRADAEAAAAANRASAEGQLADRLEKARRAVDDANTADKRAVAVEALNTITAKGAEAVQQAGQLTDQSKQQILAAQTGVLKAGAELQKIQAGLAASINQAVGEVAAQLQSRPFRIDAIGFGAQGQALEATFEGIFARGAEVFDFAQGLLDAAGGRWETVGQALTETLGATGKQITDDFKAAFERGIEAAKQFAAAADKVGASAATLEGRGFLNREAQGLEVSRLRNEIGQVLQRATEDYFSGVGTRFDIGAIENAVRQATLSANPVAELRSIAQVLNTEEDAQEKLAGVMENLREAQTKATNATSDLTNAINNLLPQINVAVSVPAGSSVASNAPVRYS